MFFILDNFLPFYLARYLTILPCPFTYLWKFQNNEKTPGDIIILHKCTKNHDHMLYCPWDTAHDTCNCCYSFWVFFTPFTPLTAQKTKFQKNEKNTWRYHHFTHLYQTLWSDDIRFLRYVGPPLVGQKRWHIEMGVPPKNFITLKYQVMIYYKNFITSAFPINFFEKKQKLFSLNLIVCAPY